MKVGWDHTVKSKEFVYRHLGVISSRMVILKAMRKMTGRGKEMGIYMCVCIAEVGGHYVSFFPSNVGVISLIEYR